MGKELDRYQALALPGTRVLPIELARCTPRIGKSRLFFKRGKLVTIDWKQVFSYRNFLVSFLVDGQILLMTDFPPRRQPRCRIIRCDPKRHAPTTSSLTPHASTSAANVLVKIFTPRSRCP